VSLSRDFWFSCGHHLLDRDPADVIENVGGEPFYLLLAMNAEGTLRLKPQNLVAGLPIRQVEEVN
jgi:hypothetical protein